MGWLKTCTICNEELCVAVDKLKEAGLSEKKIFKQMSDESKGDYTAGAIRQRYKYRKGGEAPSPPKQKRADTEKINIFSEEFKASFENFYKQIEVEKNNNWEKTSKEAALFHLKKLGNLIRKK
jgi:pyruvate formate-lyase activating enzyme-like uncharacterized protein